MADIILRDGNAGGIRPQFEHEITPERRNVRTPQGAGAVFSRQINERALRTWSLRWSVAPYGQAFILGDKWEQSRGGALPMDFLIEDGSETVEVVFIPDSFEITQTSATTFRLRADIEEVHA